MQDNLAGCIISSRITVEVQHNIHVSLAENCVLFALKNKIALSSEEQSLTPDCDDTIDTMYH